MQTMIDSFEQRCKYRMLGRNRPASMEYYVTIHIRHSFNYLHFAVQRIVPHDRGQNLVLVALGESYVSRKRFRGRRRGELM